MPKFTTNKQNTLDFSVLTDQNGTNYDIVANPSRFLSATGGSVTGNLSFIDSAKILYPDGSEQVTAFSTDRKVLLETVSEKVSNVSYEPSSHTTTITGNLILDIDNTIPLSKIENFTTLITDLWNGIGGTVAVNDTQNSDIVNLQSTTESHTDQITDLTTNKNDLQTLTASHSIDINNHASYIDQRQMIINDSNKLASDYVSYQQETVKDKLDALSQSIATMQTDITDVTVLMDQFDPNDMTAIAGLAVSVTNMEDAITSHTDNINNIQNSVSNIMSDISALQDTVADNITSIIQQDSSITTLNTNVYDLQAFRTSAESTLTSHTSSISSHTSTLTSNATTLTSHENAISSLQNTVISHASTLDTKQDIIDTNNLLNANVLGLGNVNNNELSTLSGIETNHTIQWQIDGIKTNMNNLTGLQDIDITDINQIQSDITSINTFISGLQDEDSSQNTVNTNLQSQLDSHSSSITSINTSLSDNGILLDGLRLDVDQHSTDLTSNSSAISTLQSDLSGVNSDLTSKA